MPGLLPDVDPDGLLEYSVVYTDRTLNHMSRKFQGVMRDVSGVLKEAYRARSAIVVPGSGTFGMEAVARQFASGRKCLVLRNGWFSFRWTQILDMGAIAAESSVLKARPVAAGRQAPFAPAPIDEVVAAIERARPDVVFAPHVETASGIILPESYLRAVAAAVHAVGGLFVLDCIASGAIWVDMAALGVDVLISAPQKGWSGPACCALVMLGERARKRIESTHQFEFLLRPAQVAADHGNLRERRPRLSRHDAHRRADPGARRDAADAALRFRAGSPRAAGSGRQGSRPAGCPRRAQRGGARLRRARRGGRLHRRSRHPVRQEVPRARAADRRGRAAAVRRAGRLPAASASACSAWTSCRTSSVPCGCSTRRWVGSSRSLSAARSSAAASAASMRCAHPEGLRCTAPRASAQAMVRAARRAASAGSPSASHNTVQLQRATSVPAE